MFKKYLTITIGITMLVGLQGFAFYDSANNKDYSAVGESKQVERQADKQFETISKDVVDRVKKVVEQRIVDSYSEHYEVKDVTTVVLSDKMDKRTNDIDIAVNFKLKAKYKSFKDFPMIAGAAKRLNIDLSVTSEELILKQIAENNRNLSKEQVKQVFDKLMANKADMEESINSFSECNVDFKAVLKGDKIDILVNRGDDVYVDASEVAPKSYQELFKIGYDTIIPE